MIGVKSRSVLSRRMGLVRNSSLLFCCSAVLLEQNTHNPLKNDEIKLNKRRFFCLKTGEYFGELALMNDDPRSATIKATE